MAWQGELCSLTSQGSLSTPVFRNACWGDLQNIEQFIWQVQRPFRMDSLVTHVDVSATVLEHPAEHQLCSLFLSICTNSTSPSKLGLSFTSFMKAFLFYFLILNSTVFVACASQFSLYHGLSFIIILLFNIPHSTVLCTCRHFKHIFEHRIFWWNTQRWCLKMLYSVQC